MAMTLKRQSSQKRKLFAAARIAARHLPPALPPVLFLTDPVRTPDPVTIATMLPPGWGVVFRHFGAPDAAAIAHQLARVCTARKLSLLIAADPALALAVGADGVHWPHARLGQARRWHGRFALMTASAHSRRDLADAAACGIDAALLSQVAGSRSPSARPPLGLLKFRELARAASLPVYGLGGVDTRTAPGVAGVAGLAAIDSLSAAFG
ncbi:thiamine phosphate synthase [Hyphomonas johnsonii]|uniref:Thiamine monophosphate synthase family protein n=1 Tax=Hyphomonas johnsonii MHS-2 TaxID=1280950 RepID=A0A059FM67_9PROT|nr:thiamine phosphate synthase [Hyphomonas johnsonii]KCZ91754.1 thiamine monophosphate synthase family protein [Hyphomonas johnsonii MHS-2]